ncbi:MAG: hypothetical protein ACLPV8_28595, partial [Steroidobacteraceae bacterium]
MMPQAAKPESIHKLRTLLGELESLGKHIDGDAISEILARSYLEADDVTSFITPRPDTYSRRRVHRTEAFEVLVMTWLPG